MLTIRRTQAAILPFPVTRYVEDTLSQLDIDAEPFKQTVAIIGPRGRDGGGASSLEYVQSVAAAQWTINHNFGYRPSSVRILNTSGREIEGQVTDTTLNQTVINFAAALAGKVVLI
jgi:hypothetical protein